MFLLFLSEARIFIIARLSARRRRASIVSTCYARHIARTAYRTEVKWWFVYNIYIHIYTHKYIYTAVFN